MQKRTHSLIEAVGNTFLGMGISYGAAFIIYPIFGMEGSAADYAVVTAIYTVLSIARGYVVRRIGNAIQFRQADFRDNWY